jgi:hypothetical protein
MQFGQLKRRTFITLLGGAAATWPLVARAQRPPKLPTIGFLGSATPLAWSQWVAAFAQRLRELGWIEGRTIAIEYRWAEGRNERYADIAAEFIRLKVNVIVTAGDGARAAKQATSEVPIVFAGAVDPLGIGLVASLARPGGNATGLSNQSKDVVGKRLELERRGRFRGQPSSPLQADWLGSERCRLVRRVRSFLPPGASRRRGGADQSCVRLDRLAEKSCHPDRLRAAISGPAV